VTWKIVALRFWHLTWSNDGWRPYVSQGLVFWYWLGWSQ